MVHWSRNNAQVPGPANDPPSNIINDIRRDYGVVMSYQKGNLKTGHRGKGIVALFRRAAKVYSFGEFEKFMVEIDSKSHVAWKYLTGMGIEHWAQSHFLERRYNMMTSNNAESLSALFKKDREREESQSCTSMLTSVQEDKLFKTLDVARKVYVESLDQFRFSVRCARNFGYIVDLNDNTCAYKQFQLESFPCTHAVKVAMHRGFPPHTLCSPYYMTDYWKAAYAEIIFPVPNKVEWEVPDHILPLNNLLPPAVGPHTPEHTHTSRIPFTREFLQHRKCGAIGHTRRYCIS
ncbi:uncharacterized protein LOC111408378 [Olea europaea var. sylvestris]|uniref:uncharacterized protein LOC111408378 n=1 Tax=Olea europaea var. sylvestris TaxID=158386 RepID=UPI000C1CE3D9|nr:uncharacterized protein LOC111408378 [Olea europaea var. sylvestris]